MLILFLPRYLSVSNIAIVGQMGEEKYFRLSKNLLKHVQVTRLHANYFRGSAVHTSCFFRLWRLFVGGSYIVICLGSIGLRADEAKTIVLLADDFESVMAGEPVSATVGYWQGNDGGPLRSVVGDEQMPGATHSQSKRWAVLDRAAGARLEGQFGVRDLAPIGGQLRVSFRMFIARNDADAYPEPSSVVEVGLGTTLTGRISLVAGLNRDNVITSVDGNALHVDRNVRFEDSSWQTWQLQVDLNQDTYEYAVDGVSSGPLAIRAVNHPGSTEFCQIEFEPGTAGGYGRDAVVYLDDVRVEYAGSPQQLAEVNVQLAGVSQAREHRRETLAAEDALRREAGTDAYYLHGMAYDTGHEVQLFLDSSAYADRWDVYRRVNQPEKEYNNPVVRADQPWEHAVGLPNVMYDEQHKIFRMWYANYDIGAWGGGKTLKNYKRTPYMMSYAESKDGVEWTKPLMDRVPYMGFEKTNILMTGVKKFQEFVILRTPAHLRQHGRFMVWYRDMLPEYGNCVNVAYSENGLDWIPHDDNPVYPRALDAQHVPVWDEQRQMWLLYARPQALAANEYRYRQENIRTRISVTVSRDMKHWMPARHILVPDELDRGNSDDNPGWFFDRMAVAKYGNQYLGFLAVQPRRGKDKGWVELASSSDGFRWHRSVQREPFIPYGEKGQWDEGHTWMLTNIVPRGHYLYLYYVGSSQTWRTRFPATTRAIGMARIRRDRFVGQYGSPNGGWLLSREVKVTGNRLLVNISPEHQAWNLEKVRYGHVKVELLDREGGIYGKQHLPGFGQDDCDPMHGDEYEQVVTWNGNADISSLRDKNIYIRFWLKSAYLFGFRFADQ